MIMMIPMLVTMSSEIDKVKGTLDADSSVDVCNVRDRRILRAVLAINLMQCALGVAIGLWAGSTALIGAALDNLADAAV